MVRNLNTFFSVTHRKSKYDISKDVGLDKINKRLKGQFKSKTPNQCQLHILYKYHRIFTKLSQI